MEATHHDGIDGPAVDPIADEPVEEPQGFDDEEDVEVTPENFLDQLRKERADEADDEKLLAIPGYDTVPLLVKYKMVDGSEITKIGKRSRKLRDPWERNLTTAIDVMIACAIGIYVEVGGEIIPLTFEGREVMGFTPDLAAALAFKSETARQTVIGTFKNKDLHIANHAARLNAWLSGSNLTLDEEFLGN